MKILKKFIEWFRRLFGRKTEPPKSWRSGTAPSPVGAYMAVVIHHAQIIELAEKLEELPWIVHRLGELQSIKAKALAFRDLLPVIWKKYVRRREADTPRFLDLIVLQEAERLGLFSSFERVFNEGLELALSPEAALQMYPLQGEFAQIANHRGMAIKWLTVLTVDRTPERVAVKLGYSIRDALTALQAPHRAAGNMDGEMDKLASEAEGLLAVALELPVDFQEGVELRTLQVMAERLGKEVAALPKGEYMASPRRCLLARDADELQRRIRAALLRLWTDREPIPPAKKERAQANSAVPAVLKPSWDAADRLTLAALLDAAKAFPDDVPEASWSTWTRCLRRSQPGQAQ